MVDQDKSLLASYYDYHRAKLNDNILFTAGIFLLLSVIWTVCFQVFHVHFSRANPHILYVTAAMTLILYAINRYAKPNSVAMQHSVLILSLLIICSLYLGSGFREGWSYFFLLPLVAGLYGEVWVLLGYSLLGFSAMIFFLLTWPLKPGKMDAIDFSNIVLLFVVIAVFSRILLNQLNRLYREQIQTIHQASDKTIEQVVSSFIVAIEAKDTYTFGHSDRVSRYAVHLASTLPEYKDSVALKSLRFAGLLHDVGKINIPESILTKTGPLSNDEFELVKTHCVVGAKMVERISGLGPIRPAVLYHHEKWDGTGYPVGLKGTDIPLEARILAIADAFDAMTSLRSYRYPFSFKEALDRLHQGNGTHFDPELISHLNDVVDAWEAVFTNYNDPLLEMEALTDLL